MGNYINISSVNSLSSAPTSLYPETHFNKYMFQPPARDELDKKKWQTKHNFLKVGKNTIAYLHVKPKNIQNKKYVIWFHGNGSDIIETYQFYLAIAETLNVGLIVVDYPGYGLSTGTPTEYGCYDAAKAILNYTKTITESEDITLIGQSIGTGIVVHVAKEIGWKTPIILISPYKSIMKIVWDYSGSLSSSFCERVDRFKSDKKIGKLLCPVKIFHGKDDTLIKISHSQELFKTLKKTNSSIYENKLFCPVWISNTGHNDILGSIDWDSVKSIILFKTTKI